VIISRGGRLLTIRFQVQSSILLMIVVVDRADVGQWLPLG